MKEKFILTDGEKFIRKNGRNYEVTACKSLAHDFESEGNAKKILFNNLSGEIRSRFSLQIWKEEEEKKKKKNVVVKDNRKKKETIVKMETKEEFLSEVINYIEKEAEDVQIDKILEEKEIKNEYLDNLTSIINTYEEVKIVLNKLPSKYVCRDNRAKLYEELSKADCQLSDIYHWAEVNNPPANKRCLFFGILKEVLVNRRSIKKAINCYDIVLKFFDVSMKFDEVITQMNEREYKEYNPRTEIWDKLNKLNVSSKKGKTYAKVNKGSGEVAC